VLLCEKMTRGAVLVDDGETETVEGDEEPEDNFVVVGVDDAEMGHWAGFFRLELEWMERKSLGSSHPRWYNRTKTSNVIARWLEAF
jgi:hypothetical protein